MPTYEFQCDKCSHVYEALLSISEYSDFKTPFDCQKCDQGQVSRVILTAPSTSIPTHMQAVPSKGKVKDLGVPINIIDQNDDGSCRVTRIGKKSDIDNE